MNGEDVADFIGWLNGLGYMIVPVSGMVAGTVRPSAIDLVEEYCGPQDDHSDLDAAYEEGHAEALLAVADGRVTSAAPEEAKGDGDTD